MTFTNISFWENERYFERLDFVIVGAGIVGMSTAYHLKKIHPKAKILLLEKNTISDAATTKNAGFACFGSPTEILDDLENENPAEVWKTVQLRWEGLKALKNWLGTASIDLQMNGSWELFNASEKEAYENAMDNLNMINDKLKTITGNGKCMVEDSNSLANFGFSGFKFAIKNNEEGQINTALLSKKAELSLAQDGVEILRGVSFKSYVESTADVTLNTSIGEIKCGQLLFCSNGFSKRHIPQFDVQPARAQVLITKPIENLKINGTFHMDRGYYYFRNINGRILLGGGRQLDFEKENTDKFGNNVKIQTELQAILKDKILPNYKYEIDRQWSGIMGIGDNKSPIVNRLSNRVACGIKMGGMGIAIGTKIGQDLAKLNQ